MISAKACLNPASRSCGQNRLPRWHPAQQLLLLKGMKPILGQRVPFWFVAPWAEWAEANPVEGAYPQAAPIIRLGYHAASEQ